LPQPAGDLLLAAVWEQAGQAASAAAAAQRVYYGYPASRQAQEAGAMLARLRAALGAGYPPPLPQSQLERAAKWLEGRDYGRARTEFEALLPQLAGAERDRAALGAAEAVRRSGDPRQATAMLESMTPVSKDADAERLYRLVQCARTLGNLEAMQRHLEELGRLHPASPWRRDALIWAGNHFLLRNDRAAYLPLFKACADNFAGDSQSAYCHWKVAWSAYLTRSAGAESQLREHVSRYPASENRAAALYFLGRIADSSRRQEEARAFYRQIAAEHPASYYVALACEKAGSAVKPAGLNLSFEALPENRLPLRRSRLLDSAGLDDWAEMELLFAARNNGQPHVIATELARQASSRGAPDRGIRYIKSVFPQYLRAAVTRESLEMWRLAFPVPFRASLEKHARANRLDPYLVAGLIRQESEFNRGARSPAGALGLMQVMPSTGRQLARRLKLSAATTARLLQPDYNIRLGTHHFRTLLDAHGGSMEAALASYNAGRTRTEEWLGWAEFREPAEFVETIPFTETRTYVQAVLRNAAVYRRVYSGKIE